MANAEREKSFLEKANDINKAIDLGTIGVGIFLFPATTIAAIGLLSFMVGNEFGKQLEKRK